MSAKKGLWLALVAFASAILLRTWHAPGVGTVALFIGCFLVVWTIRLKRGDAGRQQWNRIRSRGKLRFVLIYGLGFAAVFMALYFGMDYMMGISFQLSRFVRVASSNLLLGCVLAMLQWRAGEKKGWPLR
jgi:hypothetical protein